MPRFRMVIGITVVVLAVAIATLGYLRSRKLPRFPYMARPLAEADYNLLAAKPGWHALHLAVAPGVELRGLMREPATPAGPWVMFFNGNSSSMLREGQQVLDALCAERGWGGVVWAYRGFDSSGGKPDPRSLEDDGFKAYTALLAEQKAEPGAVHIVGFSLGTGIAAAVAARAHAQAPASLTLLAPMTHLYIGERTQLHLHLYQTENSLAQIESPTLVIHGTRDDTLNVENGRTVAKALGTRATFVELPRLGHYELPMSPEAQDATREFIGRHSGAAPAN